MVTNLEPIHIVATIGSDPSKWPIDWPAFSPGNISGGASLGAGRSAFKTLSANHSMIVQHINTYSAKGQNPGSLRPGPFADRHGAIGASRGFAIFKIFADGMMAMADLLDGDSYNTLTVNEAIEKWAPPDENDTAAYQSFVINHIAKFDQNITYIGGYSKPADYGSVKLLDLTDTQFTSLVFGIIAREGRTTSSGPGAGGGG